MKFLRLLLLIFVAGRAALAATPGLYPAPPGPFTQIARKGHPAAQIILPAQPTELETFAASELQNYLAKISDAKLPIVKEGERTAHRSSVFIVKSLEISIVSSIA